MDYDIEFIKSFSVGNRALEFLYDRLKSDKYRGAHKSQHNRIDLDTILIVLEQLDKIALKYRDNILYSTKNKQVMKDYNIKLNEV